MGGGGIEQRFRRHADGEQLHLLRQLDGNNKGSGGGIENQSGGTLTVSDSTISGNSTVELGGGINNAGTLTLQNSIVAGNTGNNSTIPDLNGTITTDSGNNLLGTLVNNSTTDPTPGPGDVFSNAPLLAALGNYGGPTQTLALLAGSPAIAAGNAAAANLPATDQRGLPRHRGQQLDIGAFQTQAPGLVFTTLGQTSLAIAGRLAIRLTPSRSPCNLTISTATRRRPAQAA